MGRNTHAKVAFIPSVFKTPSYAVPILFGSGRMTE